MHCTRLGTLFWKPPYASSSQCWERTDRPHSLPRTAGVLCCISSSCVRILDNHPLVSWGSAHSGLLVFSIASRHDKKKTRRDTLNIQNLNVSVLFFLLLFSFFFSASYLVTAVLFSCVVQNNTHHQTASGTHMGERWSWLFFDQGRNSMIGKTKRKANILESVYQSIH